MIFQTPSTHLQEKKILTKHLNLKFALAEIKIFTLFIIWSPSKAILDSCLRFKIFLPKQKSVWICENYQDRFYHLNTTKYKAVYMTVKQSYKDVKIQEFFIQPQSCVSCYKNRGGNKGTGIFSIRRMDLESYYKNFQLKITN